jgi:hypothetical protein
MRPLTCLAASLLLVLWVASPGSARVATIRTTAPLQDHAELSVKTALKEAVDAAVKGAVAMGLRWVQISQALVFEDAVAVQILASDTAPEPGMEESPNPDTDLGTGSDQPSETEL